MLLLLYKVWFCEKHKSALNIFVQPHHGAVWKLRISVKILELQMGAVGGNCCTPCMLTMLKDWEAVVHDLELDYVMGGLGRLILELYIQKINQ